MSTIMQLPWEIREQIWIYALQRTCPLRRPKISRPEEGKPTECEVILDNVASLLSTCKQVYEESMPILYMMNDICPYFSYYLDRAVPCNETNHHQHPPDEIPSCAEWVALSDAQKYADLGIAAQYMPYLVSLVIYHDGISRSPNLHCVERSDCSCSSPERNKVLIPELVCWMHQKAPLVQCISVRYRARTPILYQTSQPGKIDMLPRRQTRFYRQVRGFHHLEVLDIRWAFAGPPESLEWGDDVPMREVIDHQRSRTPGSPGLRENCIARTKGNFLGDVLLHAFTSQWRHIDRIKVIDPPSALVGTVRCGHRWLFLLRPAQKAQTRNHLAMRYIAYKKEGLSLQHFGDLEVIGPAQ